MCAKLYDVYINGILVDSVPAAECPEGDVITSDYCVESTSFMNGLVRGIASGLPINIHVKETVSADEAAFYLR